jgi:hypothetical protein
MRVTGPKVDVWLVKTVGALVSVIGVVLVVAGLRRRVGASDEMHAVSSAAALTAVDVNYVVQGRISPVYLLDATAEMFLVAAWIGEIRRRRVDVHGDQVRRDESPVDRVASYRR